VIDTPDGKKRIYINLEAAEPIEADGTATYPSPTLTTKE
jgi:hypothetical protein